MKYLALLLFASALVSQEPQPYEPPGPPEPPPSPWLTGPLLAPTGTATPFGDFVVESYAYFTTTTGTYNSGWDGVSAPHNFFSFNPQFLLFFGLTPWMDINIVPQFFVNSTRGKTSTRFGDFSAALDFQVYPNTYDFWFPGIKFAVREVFPTGSFQRLDANNFNTDDTGAGTFGTAFNLVLYKVYHFIGHHFMSMTLSGSYQINSPVHVHGLNTYGGADDTDGRVMPGNILQLIASFEFTLSQNWVFAIDNVYTHQDVSQFCGNPGTASDGTPAIVGLPSSEQISFAPAIEYNFSATLGIIAGCWFTAAGRNSARFASGVIECIYTY